MSKQIDMIGRKFGRLTVIERAEDHILPCGQHQRMWKCSCDCGNTTTVSGHALRSGTTQSCGCYKMDVLMDRNIKYRHQNRRLFKIWYAMVHRCTDPTAPHFDRYGGRGIGVCDEWMDFDAFADWSLTHEYADNLTIDRIDNDAGYSPDNCRWASRKTQANNRGTCRAIGLNGTAKTIMQWSEETGIAYGTLYGRLAKGWRVEDALSVKPTLNTILECNGEKHILKEWAEITGIHRDTIMKRIKHGWSVSDALSVPVEVHRRQNQATD